MRPKRARIDIANLLLAAVMFHGYCLFMDYLIVWGGKLAVGNRWYLARASVFHGFVVVPIAGLFVAMPILLLLFPPRQIFSRRPRQHRHYDFTGTSPHDGVVHRTALCSKRRHFRQLLDMAVS